MDISVKTISITKSKILQMDFIGVPVNPNTEVLGWVNIDKKRYVIVKNGTLYYRAEFIKMIIKELKNTQFQMSGGGYEWPSVTNIKCETFNRGSFSYSPERDEYKNIALYETLLSFKRKTEIAGQIYY